MNTTLPVLKKQKEASNKLDVNQLITFYKNQKSVQEIVSQLENNSRAKLQLEGLIASSKAILAASVYQAFQKIHVFILEDKETAAYFLNDLENLLPQKQILFFPASVKKAYQEDEVDNANVLLRAEVLNQINKKKHSGELIVTYPEALSEKVVNKITISKNTIDVKVGENLNLDFILEVLIEYGFDRVDFVYEPGQFSIRGGIVDVFSFANELPYRIELFGDEIESIRTFDIESQLSVNQINNLQIIPNIQTHLIKDVKESFLNYLPENTSIWINDLKFTNEIIEQKFEKAQEAWQDLLDENQPKPQTPNPKNPKNQTPNPKPQKSQKSQNPITQSNPKQLFETPESFQSDLLEKRIIEFGNHFYLENARKIEFKISPQPAIRKNFDLLINQMKENEKAGKKNLLFAESKKQIERLYQIFQDKRAAVSFYPFYTALHEGFIDHQAKFAFFTDHQIFERYHKYKLKSRKLRSQSITLKELKNLQKGDFVSHIDHGVGVYDGLEILTVNGKNQEAVRLIYQNNDLLYVGINSLHKIAKFSGKEGTTPKINKLGSDAWQRLKSKTKKRVIALAIDLIQLYAKRKAKKGFEFSPDTYLQHELEASFIYEDTPDQEKSTQAVKADMEKTIPMDRLICGDVGFGKTEIAVRAAFKAVADNKQVAVMVPTTILALQHFQTFSERLREFPCTVDYINRFRTYKQKKETLKKLEEGKVDILIGTHGIAGKQVKFKDLGLLIIDEEQKFGVGVKEKLKEIKVNVDTLTLTATPIPRTLQFSLMGARDLSIINTPPPNRQPVQTELMPLDDDKIRDAIMYEVDRDGQVFFVHNRVKNIVQVAAYIQKLCPDVRICIGHGQMEGKKLEDTLLDFIAGDYDVLVATNIIESGLDIPNANTIIINSAQNFGLSDLHQMRGRVGRSNKKAFCYLVVPPLSTLSSDARRRLRAIEEFSELGSGFNVAMRDLDIRGAGNLLGGEQSGFISEIGFEMYHKILDEAIQELKESEYKELFADQPDRAFVADCQVDTDFEALIPIDYVVSTSERLNLYMTLDNTKDESELQVFIEDLKDRFGEIPAATKILFDLVRLRWVAKKIGFEKVVLKKQKMRGYFVSGDNEKFYQSEIFGKVLSFLQQNPHQTQMKQTEKKVILTFQDIASAAVGRRVLEKILIG